MKILLFAWGCLAALMIGLAPGVFRLDRPPVAFPATQAGYPASRPAAALQAGVPVGSGAVASSQALPLPAPALEAPAVTGTLPATAQSMHAWEGRWVAAVVLVGGALAMLALELVRRLERGYLDGA